MPTYEYQCNKCKAVYDLRQGFDAETTHTCEECGKGIAKRVLHAPPVVFKGSGWYATDSRNKTSAVTDNSDSKSDGDDSSSTGTSSETATTETKPKAKAKAEPKSTSSESAATT
ncbi:MAG: FmdB family zinc ribbon protein [bacterium]